MKGKPITAIIMQLTRYNIAIQLKTSALLLRSYLQCKFGYQLAKYVSVTFVSVHLQSGRIQYILVTSDRAQ